MRPACVCTRTHSHVVVDSPDACLCVLAMIDVPPNRILTEVLMQCIVRRNYRNNVSNLNTRYYRLPFRAWLIYQML